MEATEAVSGVTLNSLELALWQCSVKKNGNYEPCRFTMIPQTETVAIEFPQQMAPGHLWVQIDFVGRINNKMAGFYQSYYRQNGNRIPLAVTQFEESAARMAFPCFDHPSQKATFDITLVVREGDVAISNGAVLSNVPEADGKRRVRFETTPKMSTYLLFWGIGDFEFIDNNIDARVRAAAMPGQSHKALLGLDFGEKALRYCEDYFKIPYPMSKMDLIAVPDFAFGAMENWGAITFRENLLLFDPDKTSQAGKERLCEVIAHEIVHQWFGNLVSPSDWRYLWLNESFATYFGYGVVHHYFPEWETWQQFLYGQTASAMARDALFETFPIEIPGGEHVVINAATAPIIYNKGASILNQMKGYIGAEGFQKGLVHYLSKHAYDCTESHHLWESFEKAAEKPISAMMQNWIEQPGFPLVTVKETENTLTLTQERFTYLTEPSPVADAEVPVSLRPWMIPLTVEMFFDNSPPVVRKVLFDQPVMSFDLDPAAVAYKVNVGQTGFYRVDYLSSTALQKLGDLTENKTLSPEDRWGLQEDLFALVRKGQKALGDYLSFLKHYPREDAFLPLISISENLYLSYLVAPAEKRQAIADVGKDFYGALLGRIGCLPTADEPSTTRVLRDNIIYKAAVLGTNVALSFGVDAFKDLMSGASLDPDVKKSVMQVGALADAKTAFSWFKEQLEITEFEHERMSILAALGCIADKGIAGEAMAYALEKAPSRNQHIPFVAFAQNPAVTEILWDWYVDHLTAFEAFHPLLYERVIESMLPICGLGREEKVVDFFNAYLSEKKKAEAVIRLSLERLIVNQRMRKAI